MGRKTLVRTRVVLTATDPTRRRSARRERGQSLPYGQIHVRLRESRDSVSSICLISYAKLHYIKGCPVLFSHSGE